MCHKSQQANFSSTRDLYFLPDIREFGMKQPIRKAKARHTSVQKLRSIEQIMFTKSILVPRQQNCCLETTNQKLSKIDNLYDKYYCLPKLFSKNRKQNQHAKIKQGVSQRANEAQIKTSKVRASLKAEGESKQNSFDFSSSFYRERFNYKIQREIAKIGFNIRYAAQSNMLITEKLTVVEEENKDRQIFKHKYTRLQLPEKITPQRQEQLQKVPSFLLKLLESKPK